MLYFECLPYNLKFIAPNHMYPNQLTHLKMERVLTLRMKAISPDNFLCLISESLDISYDIISMVWFF